MYDGVLSGAPKGSFVTLLSLPQWHAAFGTMPHTLASVDQSPVHRHRMLTPPRRGCLWLDFGGECWHIQSISRSFKGSIPRGNNSHVMYCFWFHLSFREIIALYHLWVKHLSFVCIVMLIITLLNFMEQCVHYFSVKLGTTITETYEMLKFAFGK
jgi:hypothetical protein